MVRFNPLYPAALLASAFFTGCADKPKDDLAAVEAAIRKAPTAEAYVDLSLRYFQAQKFDGCITAATEAVRRKPESSIAYNNMAACYGGLGKWDEEIAAAKQALRLSPDFQLAKNNLAWAESKKAGR